MESPAYALQDSVRPNPVLQAPATAAADIDLSWGGVVSRAARQLLTMDEKDPKRLFEGNALIRRLVRVGVLDDQRMKLDYVLALRIEDFLERRLQVCTAASACFPNPNVANRIKKIIRPKCTSSDWPSRFTTPVYSSASVTSASESKLSMSLLSSSVSTRRNTSILL